MSTRIHKGLARVACYLTLWLTCAVGPSYSQTQQPRARTRPDNSLLQGGKFQIGEIIGLLRSVRSGRLKQSRLIEALESRGIAFPASELNLARLMNSGAAEPVLETVEKLGVPPPAPPLAAEPPKPSFSLTVTCQPAECETRIGDDPFRTTTNGTFTFSGLNPGRIILDARKSGFETKTDIVTLDPAALPPAGSFQHAISLTPTDDTQRQWGAILLASVLAAAHFKPDPVTISGSVTVTGSSATEWKLTARLSGDGANSLDLTKPQGRVTFFSAAGLWQGKTSFSRSPFRGTRAEKANAESTLLRNMDIWIAHEYSSVLRELSSPGIVARSRSDPSATVLPKLLELKTGRGSETVSFTPELRLSAILLSNPPGSNEPERIEFSDYRKMPDVLYPAQTHIRFADSETHSIVLRTNTVSSYKNAPRSP